jgi:hypothetical protein
MIKSCAQDDAHIYTGNIWRNFASFSRVAHRLLKLQNQYNSAAEVIDKHEIRIFIQLALCETCHENRERKGKSLVYHFVGDGAEQKNENSLSEHAVCLLGCDVGRMTKGNNKCVLNTTTGAFNHSVLGRTTGVVFQL